MGENPLGGWFKMGKVSRTHFLLRPYALSFHSRAFSLPFFLFAGVANAGWMSPSREWGWGEKQHGRKLWSLYRPAANFSLQTADEPQTVYKFLVLRKKARTSHKKGWWFTIRKATINNFVVHCTTHFCAGLVFTSSTLLPSYRSIISGSWGSIGVGLHVKGLIWK